MKKFLQRATIVLCCLVAAACALSGLTFSKVKPYTNNNLPGFTVTEFLAVSRPVKGVDITVSKELFAKCELLDLRVSGESEPWHDSTPDDDLLTETYLFDKPLQGGRHMLIMYFALRPGVTLEDVKKVMFETKNPVEVKTWVYYRGINAKADE